MRNLLFFLVLLPLFGLAQSVPQANKVPWYEFSNKLSTGKLQLKQSGEYSTDQTIPAITGSIFLDTITANRTLTFLDGSVSTDKGVIIMIENTNNSAFVWLVDGNVKEAETGADFDTIPRGLHMFRWNGSYWNHQSQGGGSSIGAINAKINKFEIFKSYDEFRATTSADTGVVYHLRLKEQHSIWRYVPTDVTSSDDTASIVVSASGKRYYKEFNGLYKPEDFGANGYDAVDDTYALQKMVRFINAIGSTQGTIAIWLDGRCNYRIAEGAAMDFDFLGDGKIIVIHGNGAKITGNTIIKRRPPAGVGASQQGMRFIIQDLQFIRTGTLAGSIAVDMGSTYHSKIESCHFLNFDTAVAVRFGLNTMSRGNNYLQNGVGLYLGYGGIWGGTTVSSQSNGSVSENDRFYCLSTSKSGISIEAASDCEVRNIIVEGQAPDYCVWFDNRSATVVKDFKLHGAHFETVPVPDRAQIYFRGAGYAEFTDIFVQVSDTFIVVDQTTTLDVNIRRMASYPSGMLFASVSSGTKFVFEDIPYGDSGDFTDNFVNGGSYATPTSVSLNPRGQKLIRSNATVGWQDIDIPAAKNVLFTPASSQVTLSNVHLRWIQDNSFDIGNTSTTRPRYVYVASAFVADATSGAIRWGTANSGQGWYGGATGVMRLINGSGVATSLTGALGNAYGTTAQRPSSPFNGMERGISDSISGNRSGWEVYTGGSWRLLASRQEVVDQNTLIQTQISAAGFTDKFTLTTTGSRTISAGQTVYEIHLKSTASITVDIGTSAAGTDIADDYILASGVTRIIQFVQTADSSFDLHFTYVSGTGNIAVILVKKVL